jgi:hypothetical protein
MIQFAQGHPDAIHHNPLLQSFLLGSRTQSAFTAPMPFPRKIQLALGSIRRLPPEKGDAQEMSQLYPVAISMKERTTARQPMTNLRTNSFRRAITGCSNSSE